MRQEEELRALQQERDEELKEQERARARVLALPHTGVKEEKTGTVRSPIRGNLNRTADKAASKSPSVIIDPTCSSVNTHPSK